MAPKARHMAYHPALRAGGVHRLNDVGEELLAELRRDLGRLDVGLDLVQVLQPQDVIVREVGNDPGEEEAERLQGATAGDRYRSSRPAAGTARAAERGRVAASRDRRR